MNPEKLFGDIEQFVDESRKLLNEGAMMELAGLEDRILILCEEVLMLSQDERLHYSARLQQLMKDLTALGEEITIQRDAVGEQIKALPDVKKAHAAYRIVKPGDEEGND